MNVVPQSTKEEDVVVVGEVRRGPWTVEEDTILIQYISCHGEGRWNLLAKSAGLRRTGKSCRLRWLNYLKPDIKRGNLTLQEQLVILELHSRWGNRWSKIAQHLPGRTDNEIKNYWRTRVQKQAKQLNMESNSQGFLDTIRCFYMPRLVEKIEQNSAPSPAATALDSSGSPSSPLPNESIAFPFGMSVAGTGCNVDGGFMGASSSSNESPSSILSSHETSSKLSNLSQISGHPAMNSRSHEFGEISQGWESSALLSDDKSFCYVGTPGYEIEEMGSTSALTDDHVADHGWFSNEMTNDVWNWDGLW